MGHKSEVPQPRIHEMSVAELAHAFPDEDSCKAYLVHHRWPDGLVRCPRCGNEARPHSTKRFHWQCYDCANKTNYRFSVLVGTLFENTKKPLRDWFRVVHRVLATDNRVTALQVFHMLGLGSYQTAGYMYQRIRAGLRDPAFCRLIGYNGPQMPSSDGDEPPFPGSAPGGTDRVAKLRAKRQRSKQDTEKAMSWEAALSQIVGD